MSVYKLLSVTYVKLPSDVSYFEITHYSSMLTMPAVDNLLSFILFKVRVDIQLHQELLDLVLRIAAKSRMFHNKLTSLVMTKTTLIRMCSQ